MQKKLLVGIVLFILLFLSFVPVWDKQLESGETIEINFWKKFFMRID